MLDFRSSWEMGRCTDDNIIYFNVRGMMDTNFSHKHMTIEDVRALRDDLDKLINLKGKNIKSYKIKYNMEKSR